MGSEVYKLSESECALKCDSRWYVSQATAAALPGPGTRDGKAAQSLHRCIRDARPLPHTPIHAHFHACKIHAHT